MSTKQQVEAPADPPHENPTSKQVVHDWIAGRVAADAQMRWAGAARKVKENAQQEGKS